MTDSAILHGIVLAGGASRRMQRDKAAMDWQGRPQLARAVELLKPLCAEVFVSVRSEQSADPVRSRFACLADHYDGAGPLAGIHAAQMARPDAAWLVLACDLPLLADSTLAALLAGRSPDRVATAFRSSYDGLPEPLCAIWEPASAPLVREQLENGARCPRKLLLNADVALLDPPGAHDLDNVNSPADLERVLTHIAHAGLPNGASGE